MEVGRDGAPREVAMFWQGPHRVVLPLVGAEEGGGG